MGNIKNDIVKISKSDKNGIIQLYKSLVSWEIAKGININSIRKQFPNFEDIDIDLIVGEGFPIFEQTIGKENFEKVKKYFGIGYSKPIFFKSNKQRKEVEELIDSLRTIRNAQYYISGYKDLISQWASKLEGAPDGLTDLVKAKIVRLYFLIYSDNHHFCEDYVYDSINKDVRIDYEKVFINNRYALQPEELFVLSIAKLNQLSDETIFYDFIKREVSKLNKKLQKEVLRVSELGFDEETGFCSSNIAYGGLTFGVVRNIKVKLHTDPIVYPIELYSMKHMVQKLEFFDLYFMYKLLKVFDLKEFETIEKSCKLVEGARFVDHTHTCYKLTNGAIITGECEKERIIEFVEYIVERGFTVWSNYSIQDSDQHSEKRDKYEYHAKKIFGAIMFANHAGYLSADSPVEDDFKVALKFIEIDKTNALEEFYDQEDSRISVEEMKARLGIDEDFEYEYFGIKKQTNLKSIIAKFAIENGYAESEEKIDFSIVDAILIPGNEDIIEGYGEGSINTKKFVEKLGFSHEFGEMFFNLSKIDMAAIEQKLLEVKKTTSTGQKKINPKLKLLVLLYCYIIENEIPCGPKNRLPKRNKALKPSNLKMFI